MAWALPNMARTAAQEVALVLPEGVALEQRRRHDAKEQPLRLERLLAKREVLRHRRLPRDDRGRARLGDVVRVARLLPPPRPSRRVSPPAKRPVPADPPQDRR
eukprot:5235968-Prymnesium_polylepis.1